MFPDRCGQSVLHIGLPHVQTVALADLPQHLGGNPGSNAVGRNIAGHYRTGGDDAAAPMVTPPHTVTPAHSQQLSPMVMGWAYSSSWQPLG